MAKYAHSDVLDGGLNAIKAMPIRMLLLKAYAPADSYATVIEQCNCARSPWPIGDFTFRGWTARRAS